MLREFWLQSVRRGVHPEDRQMLSDLRCVNWSLAEARPRAATFAKDEHLHSRLHVSLYPQPFIGDLSRGLVYILFGNPGFEPTDYDDELDNPAHAAACEANLSQTGIGFYPLLSASTTTGAGRYWSGRLRSLVRDLSHRLGWSADKTEEFVVKRLVVLEAGAYHSKRHPGDWADELPSSRIAQAFVREALLPRASRGDALVFVWRRASFWGVPESGRGILYRPPEKAQLKNITAPERDQIVDFMAQRARDA